MKPDGKQLWASREEAAQGHIGGIEGRRDRGREVMHVWDDGNDWEDVKITIDSGAVDTVGPT